MVDGTAVDGAHPGAIKALRKIVPWADDLAKVEPEPPTEEPPPPPAAAPPEAVLPMPTSVLPEPRPAWAVADFPASLDELLQELDLQHAAMLFEGETIVSSAVGLQALGPAAFFARLKAPGGKSLRMGDRQRLLGALTRATQRLQTAASSLVDATLEARLAGQVGPNLLAFVATFPPSEAAALSAAAAALSNGGVSTSLSIASFVDAMSRHEPATAHLIDVLTRQSLHWLSDVQVEMARTLAAFTLLCVLETGPRADGALAALSHAQTRLCVASGILLPSAMIANGEAAPWRALPLNDGARREHPSSLQHCGCAADGGALLILSAPRTHRWKALPASLGVIEAVMGGALPQAQIDQSNRAARRTLTRGEIGILHSNVRAWQRALDAGWEWALVLEDDATFVERGGGGSSGGGGSGGGDGGGTHDALLRFLDRLPALVDAAGAHEPAWQMLVLSPVNTPYDFFRGTPAFCIPHILGSPQTIRTPEYMDARTPQRSAVRMPPCWQRCPPTYHAFGWVYRRQTMRLLVDEFEALKRGDGDTSPPLDPLDVCADALERRQHGPRARARLFPNTPSASPPLPCTCGFRSGCGKSSASTISSTRRCAWTDPWWTDGPCSPSKTCRTTPSSLIRCTRRGVMARIDAKLDVAGVTSGYV